jgi:hypothetical protein
MTDFTDADRTLLTFEGRFWRHRGAKDEAVRREFGLTPWQYQQRLFAVCERPAALAEFPVLVNRVNRLRNRTRRA